MAKIIDFKTKLAARAEQHSQLRLSVERRLMAVGSLNAAIEQMWEEGCDNVEIAALLHHAADELAANS